MLLQINFKHTTAKFTSLAKSFTALSTSLCLLSRLWLHQACRGLEFEAVSSRQLAKSVGCSKNFRGKEKLDTKEKVCFHCEL